MQLPPHPTKVAVPTATSSASTLEQQSLLDRLTEPQLIATDDDMVINEPAKPVASPSKHPDNQEFVVDGELLH